VALADLKITKAKARERPYRLHNSLGSFVLVRPNGSKLWRQMYQLDGKERLIAHGSYPAVSLRVARTRRDENHDRLDAGTDPAVQKRLGQIEAETQARTTFLLGAEEYLRMAHDREFADATRRSGTGAGSGATTRTGRSARGLGLAMFRSLATKTGHLLQLRQ